MNKTPNVLRDISDLKVLKELASKKRIDVFLIGGFLRDCLLKREGLDFDFAVSKNAISLARAFSKEIKGAFVLLDKERGCARVAKKEKTRVLTFDFADYRGIMLKNDLAHRDFTINTLCADIRQVLNVRHPLDAALDYKGARKDIRAKKIRMVTPRAFREDPLRILRAFSLRASLNFTIDPKTRAQIKKDKESLRDVSYERIRDELFKIFSSSETYEVLCTMDRLGVLDIVIPQVHLMYHVKQGGYHHLDVWKHTLESVKQFDRIMHNLKDEELKAYLNECLVAGRTRYSLIKLALLLHDIGKPQALQKRGKRYYFYGHERIGKSITRHIAFLLRLSTKERYVLEDMVFLHLRPGYLSNFKKPSKKAVFRFFRDAKEEVASILLLSLADQRATRGIMTSEEDQRHHEKIVKKLIKQYFEQKKQKPFVRLINGHDLINKLKLKPSPLFAKILSEIEERQAAGTITTKTQALTVARKLAKIK